MSFACQILASFLLMVTFSTQDAAPKNMLVHGILDQDIRLNISASQVNDDTAHIYWEKDGVRIVQKSKTYQQNKKYQVLKNGTLEIKHLERNDSGNYKVEIYKHDGKNIFEKLFDLKILEAVSKPVINWDCVNKTLVCKVTNGTDHKLKLYRNGNGIKEGHKFIIHSWSSLDEPFKCTAKNEVSEESDTAAISCPEKLDIYLIVGICGGGIIFFIFVALLILYISKRKKQRRRRNGEELEIRAHRITSEERSRKPHQIPGSAPQTPAASQPPPPPSHRSQAPGHRPPLPGHRVPHQQQQQQQQKRPLPPLDTQRHQQKGPPLPRPRVQPKPPRGASENP